MSTPAPSGSPPLPQDKRQLLTQLTENLTADALLWISGYTAGLAANHTATTKPAAAQPAQPAKASLTVLYGSQTGNAKRWAERIARDSGANGLTATLTSLADYPPRRIEAETRLAVVISTQGDGEPPDDALGFMEFLASKRAPRLENLHYAVLALGDSSYPAFCATGRALDERLQALGARRLAARADCDLDIGTVAEPWWQQTAIEIEKSVPQATAPTLHTASVTPLHRPATIGHDRPVPVRLLANQRITGSTTDKDIRHLELTTEGITYAPGDALGIWHRNPAPIVDAVLAAAKLNGEQSVNHGADTLSLRQWLTEKREITKLTLPYLRKHAEHNNHPELLALLTPKGSQALRALFENGQLLDALQRWPIAWSAETFLSALRPLTPRLYSIASSQTVAGDEVHLTVARVAYTSEQGSRLGAASNWLAALDEDATLPVYVEPNPRFRLPRDTDRDIIMIGAGTGVAPYRAFLQERVATGAHGHNWLFFGAQHFHSQFLYQLEWQRYLRENALHRIELAFSRDQPEKIYVQHRLAENGRDVYARLEGGAHVYVCGALAMEKAVQATLREVLAKHGRLNHEQSTDYLARLQKEGRYCRDVY